jgi:glycosyltransferase involved in cell wall biosynthesis
VLLPTYNTESVYLEAAVRSVIAQTYPRWELRIVDDGSTSAATLEALHRIAHWDERISLAVGSKNGGISHATNVALNGANGDYVAMLDHDDELTEDALYEVVLTLNEDPSIDVIYTDQDYVSPEGAPVGHLLKPNWSPQLFRGVMFVGHLLIVRRTMALAVGGFDSAYDFVQDFEFMLRLSERTHRIQHIPKVLYHWRRIPASVAGGGKADRGIERLQAAAVQAHLGRLRLHGRATPNPHHPHRVTIEPDGKPRETSLDVFVHGRATPGIGIADIEKAVAQAPECKARLVVPASWCSLEINGPMAPNFILDSADPALAEAARLCYFLGRSAAEFVLIKSVEVTIESTGWLERLLLAAQEPDVAAVCSSVLSPSGLVLHAGWVVGFDGELRPAMRGLDPRSDGYAGSISCAREISASSADLVLLRRSAIAAHIHHDLLYTGADLLIADLTFRMTRSGLRAICVPNVRARRLGRNESLSGNGLDGLIFQDIWANTAAAGDPFYNPNFLHDRADYT